jgi:hypothetical protein
MQEIAVGAVQLDTVDPSRSARCAEATKASRMRFNPLASSAKGGASSALCGTADGPSGSQPPLSVGISCPPSQGRWLDALRPACASCITTAVFEFFRTEARIGFRAASLASL